MRTPSMVSEVSAIEVASTTLRCPFGAGEMARSCTAASSAPNSGTISVLASLTRSSRKFWVRRISAAPGRNASTEPGSARSACAMLSAICRSSGMSGLRDEIACLHRKGAAFALDHRRIAQQFSHPRAVQRRRHHQQPQILAQAGLRVACQCKAEIGVERTLVKFVEQHRGDAAELGIVEDLAGENPLGHHFDARGARHLGAEAHAVADGFAGALAQRLRHALGAGASGDPPRLQHDDLFALRPGLIEQRQRHPRGLAGPGRRHQHRGVAALQRAREIVEHRVDRKGRVEGAGQYLEPVITREKAGDPVNSDVTDHEDREYSILRLRGV